MQKIRLFHWFVKEIWLIKNPAISLIVNILAHISETKIFQIWDLCRNPANNINFLYRTNSVKIDEQIF